MTVQIAPGLRRVLVATDFSSTADAAVAWAVEVAKPHGADVRLVHSLALPTPVPGYVLADGDFGQELRAAAQSRLDQAAARLADAGTPVDTDLRMGIPSQAILAAAEEWRPELLVIGTRGLTGLAHLLLGSTAERVVQKAQCPVLSVHPHDAERHRPIRTVVVPTDFSRDADRALEKVLHLFPAPQGAIRLVLVHAYHLPIEYTAYGPIPTSVHYLEDVAGEAEQRLKEHAKEYQREGVTVEAVCREGFAPDVIVEEATQRNADLVAMGTHGRSGLAHLLLGSTAERVVQKAPCPVMTMRRPPDEEEEA